MQWTIRGRCAAAALFWAWTSASAAAGTEGMELSLKATGAAPLEFQASHSLDIMHSCALLGPPDAEQTLVLTFNASQSEMLLQPSDFGFSLSVAGRVGTVWNERQPSAILQVSIGKIVFLGLHASDPAFRLQLTVDRGGNTGSFVATHLREHGNGRTIDLKGTWRCFEEHAAAPRDPPSAAAGPPRAPAPPDAGRWDTRSAQASSPTSPDQHHFRIFHSDACQGSDCAIWTVINTRTGETFAAPVTTKALKLPRALREQAQAGEIQLWITGTQGTGPNGQPVVNARRLEGVAPRRGNNAP